MADEQEKPTIKIGTYKNFKGHLYTVYGIGQHTETGEWFVVYEGNRGYGIQVRPYAKFFEEVDRPEYNYKGPRFTWISE